MKTFSVFHQSSSGPTTRALLFLIIAFLAGCKPQATPTMFVPPTAAAPLTGVIVSPTPTVVSTPTPVATNTPLPISATPCTNDLSFVQDTTIPDGTSVTPGESIDKQWLVTNSGTCNWDGDYRLKLISGDALGVPSEQGLFPARAGTQATLRIVFTAPQEIGTYESAWQAFAPDGTAFGQTVNIQINVSP